MNSDDEIIKGWKNEMKYEEVKEEMMNDLIKTRGFEDEMTIYFCEMCEKPNMDNRELCVLYRLIINYPIYDENETEKEFQERMDKFFENRG